MIIDCHGHFTTVPKSFRDWRTKQVDAANDPANAPKWSDSIVTDDDIREGVGGGQLRLQQERGGDLTLFSPIAGLMSHHLGNERTSLEWAEVSNNLVKRACDLYPENFVPVCQLPQSPGAPPKNSIPELRRCVEEMGFVGVNLNPDPTGGYWTGKPMTDKEWYPLYEVIEELGDVLYQVIFHTDLAATGSLGEAFDIQDVAELSAQKMMGRHPHVFGDVDAATADEVEANWATVTERNKDVIAKQDFSARAEFPAGADRVVVTDESADIVIPRLREGVSGSNFEILIGFTVTPEMADFNRQGKRFRVNAGAPVQQSRAIAIHSTSRPLRSSRPRSPAARTSRL